MTLHLVVLVVVGTVVVMLVLLVAMAIDVGGSRDGLHRSARPSWRGSCESADDRQQLRRRVGKRPVSTARVSMPRGCYFPMNAKLAQKNIAVRLPSLAKVGRAHPAFPPGPWKP